MILKNRLKELRARDGLNQSELAKLAGSRASPSVSWNVVSIHLLSLSP